MKYVRALLFGSVVGDALLNFTSLRNFWVVSGAFAGGLFVTKAIHSVEGPRFKRGVSRRKLVMLAAPLNALTILRIDSTSEVFPRLTLLTLGAEDNSEWLGIASTAMFSENNRTSFGLLYHAGLSLMNGLQVLLAQTFGFEISGISTPINSVNLAYLLLLFLFPWISLSLPIQKAEKSSTQRVQLFNLLVINLVVLGAMSEAYRIGHLSAAATIFFASLAILALFARGAASPKSAAVAVLPVAAALTLWHPFRPLAAFLAIMSGAYLLACRHRNNAATETQANSRITSRRTVIGIVVLSITLVGTSTVITGLLGIMAPAMRSLGFDQPSSIWQGRRATYLSELVGAPGGTVSVGTVLFISLYLATLATSLYVFYYVSRLKIHAFVGLTLPVYLTFVLILDALDDGTRSYGPLKMTWMFIPFLACLTLSWLFTSDLGTRLEKGFALVSLLLTFSVAATYATEDPERLHLFLTSPDPKSSATESHRAHESNDEPQRWEVSPAIETLTADQSTLGCVRLGVRDSVAVDFEAYSCGRRLYRVTLTALTPSQRVSTAIMWRSLGRLSLSEMMGMIARFAEPTDMTKKIIVLNDRSEFVASVTLTELLDATLLDEFGVPFGSR